MENNNNDLQIVKVTNISNVDFTAEAGARFNGRDYSIPAGKSLRCPFSLGEHLARHLARMIMIKGASVLDKNIEKRDLPIWSEESEKDLVNKIMKFEGSDELVEKKSEDDILKEKVEALNRNIVSEGEGEEGLEDDLIEIKSDGLTSKYSDKAEVIEELERRKISFNPRYTKATLEKLLKD